MGSFFSSSTAFDRFFHRVIMDFEDSFNAAVVKEVRVISDDTGAVTSRRVSTDFTRMNWVNPEHKQEYTLFGRLYVTDAILLSEPTVQVSAGDTIVNVDTETAFDVLGIKDFVSHKEIHACYSESGFNNGIVASGKSLARNMVLVDGP